MNNIPITDNLSPEREEILDLREKLMSADEMRLQGVKTYTLEEVNAQLENYLNN